MAHFVSLRQVEQGRACIAVTLEGSVTAEGARGVAHEVDAKVEALAGRPFALLFDLRKVSAFDGESAPVMQGIELEAAGRGLEAVAHLVASRELVDRLDQELKQLHAEALIGNFTDEGKALAFLSGGGKPG